MDNNFGNFLKKLITDKETKSNIVSQQLGYDPTYLSKWITGKKLPSEKNIDSICEKLAHILSDGNDFENIKTDLMSNYYSDLGFSTLEGNMNKNISLVTSDVEVAHLIADVLQQLEYSKVKDITINTTINIFQEFEYHMADIINKLHNMNLKSLRLNMCASFEKYAYDPFILCNNILSLTSGNYFIDFNIHMQKTETPQFLVINDVFALNIVHLNNVVFLCYYSFDKKYIEAVNSSYGLIIRHMEKALSYVMPISLRKTNVQLNQFLQDNQRILFSESPSILIPKSIFQDLIRNNELNLEGAEWHEHMEYLEQVSKVFEKYTKFNKVKILIYESLLVHYINTGRIEIGGKKHVFTKEQVKEHFMNICECMRQNENFEFYCISDTVDFNNFYCSNPSIFLTPSSISIGNTNIYTDEVSNNFYFSTEKPIINIFEGYLDSIIEKSYCLKLTADRLAAYIA
ncbi:MAG TPA: hypothetical protein DEF04_00515 [Clostridiales bacterium]|nr:hypothetical protein [Clostridiales bacterium]